MFTQIYEKRISKNRVSVYAKANNFKIGEINFSDSTFYCVKRSHKNVFRLFGGGLGLNAELLSGYDFRFIIIPFNDTLLKTTRAKWLKLGVVSPFCNHAVDKQIILKLKDINLDESELNQTIEPTLFTSISRG